MSRQPGRRPSGCLARGPDGTERLGGHSGRQPRLGHLSYISGIVQEHEPSSWGAAHTRPSEFGRNTTLFARRPRPLGRDPRDMRLLLVACGRRIPTVVTCRRRLASRPRNDYSPAPPVPSFRSALAGRDRQRSRASSVGSRIGTRPFPRRRAQPRWSSASRTTRTSSARGPELQAPRVGARRDDAEGGGDEEADGGRRLGSLTRRRIARGPVRWSANRAAPFLFGSSRSATLEAVRLRRHASPRRTNHTPAHPAEPVPV